MSSERTFSGIAALVAAISMFLLSNQCLAQGEQVLAEVLRLMAKICPSGVASTWLRAKVPPA